MPKKNTSTVTAATKSSSVVKAESVVKTEDCDENETAAKPFDLKNINRRRGPVKAKLIEDKRKRTNTLWKRKNCLVKKAFLLAKRCGQKVFLAVHDPRTNRMTEFSSHKELDLGELRGLNKTAKLKCLVPKVNLTGEEEEEQAEDSDDNNYNFEAAFDITEFPKGRNELASNELCPTARKPDIPILKNCSTPQQQSDSIPKRGVGRPKGSTSKKTQGKDQVANTIVTNKNGSTCHGSTLVGSKLDTNIGSIKFESDQKKSANQSSSKIKFISPAQVRTETDKAKTEMKTPKGFMPIRRNVQNTQQQVAPTMLGSINQPMNQNFLGKLVQTNIFVQNAQQLGQQVPQLLNSNYQMVDSNVLSSTDNTSIPNFNMDSSTDRRMKYQNYGDESMQDYQYNSGSGKPIFMKMFGPDSSEQKELKSLPSQQTHKQSPFMPSRGISKSRLGMEPSPQQSRQQQQITGQSGTFYQLMMQSPNRKIARQDLSGKKLQMSDFSRNGQEAVHHQELAFHSKKVSGYVNSPPTKQVRHQI